MAEFTSVIIGIQARSTSKRFPRKVFETIDGKPILKHVIDACEKAAMYMNNHSHKTQLLVKVALAVPAGDEVVSAFKKKVTIIEGPEDDVLTRYMILADRMRADYIVRVTADCPLIPPFLITKHIKTAVMNEYDYLSNVFAESRTALDGYDCEVISARLLKHLHENATEQPDREHVTTMARREPPEWAKLGAILHYLNLSHIKLSVDTPDDLERVRAEYDRLKLATDRAEARFGKSHLHKF